jgi:thioredoxin 1
MTTEEFNEQIKTEGNTLVDFWAAWCGPCKMLGPVVDQIDAENPNLNVIKVDVDASRELAQEYNIRSIPTLAIFREGKPVALKTGAMPKVKLQEWIDENAH